MTREKGLLQNQYVENYVVFDLETTGLNPQTDKIIELSGVRVRRGLVEDKFSTLVNPCLPIPPSATRINHITDKMVQNAPLLRNALEAFLDFIGNDILVGHNIHSFDLPFLRNSIRQELERTVENNYIDTLYLAKRCLPGRSHYRLTDLAEHFQIETKGAHRALNDCLMNQQCYEKLGALLKQQTENPKETAPSLQAVPSCPECGCALIKRKGKFGEFWGCSSFPLCRYTCNRLPGHS